MKTTWKEIQPVPTSQEFLDVVLSRTQRRLPTQIRSGFKISRIRGMHQAAMLWSCSLMHGRFLYPQGQIHTGDLLGEVVPYSRWISAAARYTSVSSVPLKLNISSSYSCRLTAISRQGFVEYTLRCGPLPNCPWAAFHGKASDRDSLPRLCPSAEICAIVVPMQATQTCRSWAHGYHMQTAERSSCVS